MCVCVCVCGFGWLVGGWLALSLSLLNIEFQPVFFAACRLTAAGQPIYEPPEDLDELGDQVQLARLRAWVLWVYSWVGAELEGSLELKTGVGGGEAVSAATCSVVVSVLISVRMLLLVAVGGCRPCHQDAR